MVSVDGDAPTTATEPRVKAPCLQVRRNLHLADMRMKPGALRHGGRQGEAARSCLRVTGLLHRLQAAKRALSLHATYLLSIIFWRVPIDSYSGQGLHAVEHSFNVLHLNK